MRFVVAPGNSLRGTASLPGDKSLSHRAAIFAALAEGESRIGNFLVAGVTRPMLEALTALGVPWQLDDSALNVQGRGLRGFHTPSGPLDCGHSATTLRLLAGALSAAGLPATLDGSAGLRRRPMNRIIEPLRQMGVRITSAAGERAPLTIHPPSGKLKSLYFALPVASAQVKTCLLLAGLAANGATTLIEPGPSRDHTERLLISMGAPVTTRPVSEGLDFPRQVTLQPPPTGCLRPLNFTLPGDMSSAAFLIVAALITPGSEVTLRGVGLNPTRTGLIEVLSRMGGDIQIGNRRTQHQEPLGDVTVRHSALQGTTVDGPEVVRMIDEFPALTVAAALATGPTTVHGAAELRHKETDRITCLCQQLRAVGIPVEEHPDGFSLPGGTPPIGGEVNPHGDHRLAMALAVAGLTARKPVTVLDAGIVQESFPGFPNVLAKLGAHVTQVQDRHRTPA